MESEMKKVFVLDTNVILYDPQSLFRFEDNAVVLPISVLEEIDKFKRDQNEVGRNARQFSRLLDELRKKGSLTKGVQIGESGGQLIVDLFTEGADKLLPPDLSTSKMDNRILACALSVVSRYRKQDVVLVSKDTNMRIKADALGITCVDLENQQIHFEQIYTGITFYDVASEAIDSFFVDKKMPLVDKGIHPNEYVILRDQGNASHTAIGRFDAHQQAIVPLIRPVEGVWGIHAKNVEQAFALDMLLNDDIQLVTLMGKAGTGKTLLAIAVGLMKTVDEVRYQKLLVSRPVFPLGRDIGYLPGDMEEKLNPWMQPIYDNIDFLMGVDTDRDRPKRSGKSSALELINQGFLEIEPLTYIRGRSIPSQFLVVDEAQNLTPHELKTIITRAGENTKVILTGDPYQVDNPYVDEVSNGLTFIVERFKSEPIAAHVTLTKGERSALAELASNLL
jgi:PhoH-like ATPase